MTKKLKPKELKFAVLATDIVIFTMIGGDLKVLLITVNNPPYYINQLGLPGGLIMPQETAENSARRHMKNKAGIRDAYLEQLYSFSSINRDPRGRVVSVAYMALLPIDKAAKTKLPVGTIWMSTKNIPKLAYDHNEIIKTAIDRLEAKVGYTNIAQFLLSREFTLTELQNVYEIILKRKLDKRNFRKKIIEIKLVKSAGKIQKGVKYRPAELFRFTKKKLQVFSDLLV